MLKGASEITPQAPHRLGIAWRRSASQFLSAVQVSAASGGGAAADQATRKAEAMALGTTSLHLVSAGLNPLAPTKMPNPHSAGRRRRIRRTRRWPRQRWEPVRRTIPGA